MIIADWIVVALVAAVFAYAYVGYPLALRALPRRRAGASGSGSDDPPAWPLVSVSLPVYNEEGRIRDALACILSQDYPAERMEVVVTSDCSDDATDAIVRASDDPRVRLVRLEKRSGKNAAERAGARHLTGDLVLNTDASVRLAPMALKRLVAAMEAGVGVASGRDVSVPAGWSPGAIAAVAEEANAGERTYVDYEMRVRDLETRTGGIVGASGCLYLVLRSLHEFPLPDALSRDFASALHAREAGYRAVSVPDALCYVPRTADLDREYRRKVRTIARGIATLAFKRHLLNPLRHGTFALKLWSHKVLRWLFPWLGVAALAALGHLAAAGSVAGTLLFALAMAGVTVGTMGWLWGRRHPLPRPVAVPTYLLMSNVAAAAATVRALRGRHQAVWEPTRREPALS